MSLCAKCEHLDWNKKDKKLYCKQGRIINQSECKKFKAIK